MNLDEVMDAWRSQDQAPFYGVDKGRLQQALREETTKRRGLGIEAGHLRFRRADVCRPGAGICADAPRRRSAHLVGLPDRDPRGGRRRVRRGESAISAARVLALRERDFGASLHHELGRHLALLDYELSRTWRVSAITRTMLPFYLGTLALYLSIWRINNEPFNWGMDGLPLVAMSGAMWYAASIARHAAQDVLPRKRRLEELLEKLNAR